MKRSTVSACHSLELIPLSRIMRFARLSSRINMILLGDAIDAEAVPGTIKITTTTDNGITKKKISFERSDVSETTANMMETLKASGLVAVYTDESGKRRVSGSPARPLSLDHTIGGGVFNITLQGEDVYLDGFLTD